MSFRYDQDELDSTQAQDGDVGFIALDSRSQPEDLPPGVVQLSENMRFNRKKAVTRKGMEKVTNEIDPSGTVPLIVPFEVGAAAIVRDTWADGLFGACVFSDPNDGNKEWIFAASGSSCWAWNEDDGVVELGFPGGQTITSADMVDMFQAQGSVYILRGERAVSQAITRLSRSSTTATLVISGGHNLVTGDYIDVTGVYPDWYNRTQVAVTVSNGTTLTYTTGTPTNLADSLLEENTTAIHYTRRLFTYTAVPHVASIYAKANSRDYMQIFVDDTASQPSCFFNLAAGTVGTAAGGATGTISDAGGGWYRCSIAFTPAAVVGNLDFRISTDGSTVSYLGDVTKGLFLFGAQAELGATPSDYEPTTSATGSRNLLTYSEDLTNDSVWTKTDTTASGNSTEEPGTGTMILNQRKAPLRWDGDFTEDFVAVNQGTISAPYIYMPPSDFGLLQQNRAILQYSRNEAAVSDVLDVESYNSIFGVFTFASGQADFLIGFHPYQDNKTLIFNRRSVYLINDIDAAVNAMTTQEITRQVGCVSRLSVVTCGPDVLFLSDVGVFRLQPGLELQLRGTFEPLSAPIADVIESINTAVVQKSCAAYWNNRYYLAVPVNGATRNNRILVYNFLNQGWESVDTLPTGMYADFLEVKQYNNTPTLFVVSQEGGVYAYEQLEVDEYGAAASEPGEVAIAGRMKTRRLIMGSTNIKKFSRLTANLSLEANSSCTVKVNTANPESTKTVDTVTTTSAEDGTFPAIINRRGYGMDVEFVNTAGRTTIVNYSAVGWEMARKNIKLT